METSCYFLPLDGSIIKKIFGGIVNEFGVFTRRVVGIFVLFNSLIKIRILHGFNYRNKNVFALNV